MDEENLIWSAVLFGTVLLTALGGVIISFLFLYQKKKYRHQQEVTQLRENFDKEMLHSKSEIQEQTLQHIATELHDNFIPTLSVINLDLAGVLPKLAEPEKTVVTDSKASVRQLMAEMKGLSNTLNTDQISKKGFTGTLEEYLTRLGKTGYLTIDLRREGVPYRLPASKEIILFRMCQESLNNIVKHAEAKHVWVDVFFGTGTFAVRIRDDGQGFDSSAPLKTDSSGLQSLRNRALTLQADLAIDSVPGKGTSISITLPVER